MALLYEALDEYGFRPGQEVNGKFPTDKRLRDAGFAIYDRRGGKEARWKLGGVVYDQQDAILLADRILDAKDKKSQTN